MYQTSKRYPCPDPRACIKHQRDIHALVPGIGACRPGHARVISKHCVLISQGPDAKTRGMPSDQHKLVSCPAYFSHAEVKNSLVNGLFRFCSKRHVGGAPIRLLHENDVTYRLNSNREGSAVKALYKRLSQTEPENGLAKECQDFHERTVCVSELANWQGEVPELQMSIRSS